jgi:four helix bundle protein
MQRFTQIKTWERSHAFVLAIYQESKTFPHHELFGITSQLRRAAVSVPCNIAEGSKRRSRPDFARFLNLAESSLAEVEALLMLCRDLGYVEPSRVRRFLADADAIARMTSQLRRAVESAEHRASAPS